MAPGDPPGTPLGSSSEAYAPSGHATRTDVDEPTSRRANRSEWDAYADEYQQLHGPFLGDAGFVWSPEGVTEAELGTLGPRAEMAGRRILEVGCGAAQCARWLTDQGAYAVGLDLSRRQLQHARRLDDATGTVVPLVEATGTHLPFGDRTFDAAFSAFGVLQFVADADAAVREVARVLRPGGRFAFSVTHPTRWAMPDDPGADGLRVTMSYFDRTPYVETDDQGRPTYVEHHRTLGDWVALLADHGFGLLRLVEPEWPEGLDREWGGWGPTRGALVPGTAIFVADLRR
ncbi:class I SAM-dependent methyltransferase [Nocardioidaceae bacterium]|nr:class I SAM-dependent methyltransferase [Nocardioidaceae bacterium]